MEISTFCFTDYLTFCIYIFRIIFTLQYIVKILLFTKLNMNEPVQRSSNFTLNFRLFFFLVAWIHLFLLAVKLLRVSLGCPDAELNKLKYRYITVWFNVSIILFVSYIVVYINMAIDCLIEYLMSVAQHYSYSFDFMVFCAYCSH